MEVEDDSAYVLHQSLLRIIGTYHYEIKNLKGTTENVPKMKELYSNFSKNLPFLYSICPAKLESRKSNCKDRVLKDTDKQRNVFKQLKKPRQIFKKNSLKMPTTAEKKELEKTLLK